MNKLECTLVAGALVLGGSLLVPVPSAEASSATESNDLHASEALRQLHSESMIDRMRAVKRLGALASAIDEPRWVEELLEFARADAHPAVAYQAEVELAGRRGSDLLADQRAARRRADIETVLDECRLSLAQGKKTERLAALERLAAVAHDRAANSQARALLATAASDDDPEVASQARATLAHLDGVDLVPPDLRAAHRLAEERRQMDEWEAALGSAAMIERLAAVKRLASVVERTLEPERAISLLRAAVADPDPVVAEQARGALAEWSGRED